jgi:hypothetical protein
VTNDKRGDTFAVSKRVVLRSEHERIVNELRSELDRAKAHLADLSDAVENCAVNRTIQGNGVDYLRRLAAAADAPTENKSNGR